MGGGDELNQTVVHRLGLGRLCQHNLEHRNEEHRV